MNSSHLSPQDLAQACADSMYKVDNASQALGMKILSVAPGRAELSMTVRDDMLNGHGSCHGGFIFALADSTFAFACNSRNISTVAQAVNIDYVRPGMAGELLTAVAVEKNLAGRTGLYDVTVSNEQGEDVAYFRGKSYRIRGTVLPEPEQ
ncbi:hydroxyphenylacetyl-CoA thioesterase PaaI [Dasania marina]|uniref:hydroxyphenylacetyl-CoA thioesterase PaaI n=1 Tax=Dasania marina TaxID=471499 RepID=UPI0030D875A8|tara:strand:+ start:94155 stop:94604 length:450 start_codon:yes stop_codon:yes gene_type:complete